MTHGTRTATGRRGALPLRSGSARWVLALWAGLAGLAVPGAGAGEAAAQQGPRHVYLTWRGSTSTTMTVNAQTRAEVPEVEVRWDTEPRRGVPGAYTRTTGGEAHRIEGLADGRWVHWIDLTGLEPGRRYWFVVGSEEDGFSAERSFRTLPDDDSPIRFVAGGDLGIGPAVRDLHAHAAARRPQFALIGGDLAYVNGVLEEVADWDDWFDQWTEVMVTPDGLTVPMVLAPGNHEVRGGYLGGPQRAPFYMGFFAQPGEPSFFRTQFGELMALYTLDTGHVVAHEEQVAWLDAAMSRDAGLPYRFAQYHIPMYPSHRDYDGNSMLLAREHWLPVFDRHGLTAAFENHDHTFKRTHPLRGDERVPDGEKGTLYFGDGAWGRGDRPVRLSDRWYLAAQGANRHVWIVDVRRDGVEYRAVDTRGGVFHVYPSDLPDAVAAETYFRTLPQQWELREGALALDVEGDRIEMTLTNREDYPYVATLRAVNTREEPVGRIMGEAMAELAPGESMTRTLELGRTAPDGPVQILADLDVDAPRGRVYARVARTVGFDPPATAPRVGSGAAAVRMDGRVDEWSAWPWRVEAPAPREDGPPTAWTGVEDASARVDFRVDGGDLVVAVRVRDDRLVPRSPDALGAGSWDEADGVVLWVDEAPDGEYDNEPYMGIPLTTAGGEVEILVTDRDWEALVDGTRAWVSPSPGEGGGWSAEVRIPLGLVGDFQDRSAPLQSVRLNVGIVDVDRAGDGGDIVLRRPEWELDWDYPEAGLIRIPPANGGPPR